MDGLVSTWNQPAGSDRSSRNLEMCDVLYNVVYMLVVSVYVSYFCDSHPYCCMCLIKVCSVYISHFVSVSLNIKLVVD